jgi:hypothetical protein
MKRACTAHVERHFCKRTHLRETALPIALGREPSRPPHTQMHQSYPFVLQKKTTVSRPTANRHLTGVASDAAEVCLTPTVSSSPPLLLLHPDQSGPRICRRHHRLWRATPPPPRPANLLRLRWRPPPDPPSPTAAALDLNISQAGLCQKTRGFRVEKILPMTVPWDVSDLSFRAGPRRGPPAHFTL